MINPSAPISRQLASIARGPRPLATVHWLGLTGDGSIRSGQCGGLYSVEDARLVASKIVEVGFDSWIVVEEKGE